MSEEILAILKDLPYLYDANEEMLEKVAKHLQKVEFKAGENIIVAGQQKNNIYIIADGKAEVYDDQGVIKTLGRGEIFGEMALFNDAPRSASVRTISDTTLLSLNKKEAMEMMASDPTLAEYVQKVLFKRLNENEENGRPVFSK